MTPEWLLRRFYNQARGERRLLAARENSEHTFFGWPPSLLRRYAKATIRVGLASLFGGFEDRFTARRVLRELEGEFAERRYQFRARN